jgi:hypothetical protein
MVDVPSSEPTTSRVMSAKRSGPILWGLTLLAIVGLVGIVVYLLFQPPPAQFKVARIVTPVVQSSRWGAPVGNESVVRLYAEIRAPLDPICLASTQYYIRASNGELWKLPGVRVTVGDELKRAVYLAGVPPMPDGRAEFYIVDIYNCGIHARRVASPHLTFRVATPPPPPERG